MDLDYHTALAGLADALPVAPRPLPPWAPSIPFALVELAMSALLLGLALFVALECFLRISTARGEGGEAKVVSVARQSGARPGTGFLVYEYEFSDRAGVRRAERLSAPLEDAALFAPGRELRIWPVRSLLTRLSGRRVIPEPMRASHRRSALPLAVLGAAVATGALFSGFAFQRSWGERRLLSEGKLVRGEVVSAEIRSRRVKPRWAVVVRFSQPAGPVESRYVFPSGRSPAASGGLEPSPGDVVWVALRSDEPTRSIPWAFEQQSRAETSQPK